jgi:hypothetical protein
MKLTPFQLKIAALCIILSTGISFLLTGQYMEPISNWYQYLPQMFHSWDPSLYPVDNYVELLEKNPTWFYVVLGKIIPNTHPYPYMMALNVLTRIVSCILIFYLALCISGDYKAGLLAVFMLSGTVDTVLGRGMINWPYFTHSAFSVPFLLLTLIFVSRKRMVSAFLTAGLCWNIHLLNASYLTLFLFIFLILNHRGFSIKSIIKGIFMLLLCSLPVIPGIILSLAERGSPDPIWFDYALHYHEKLLSPFTQPLHNWVQFAAYLFFLFIIVKKASAGAIHRKMSISLFCTWVLCFSASYLFIRVLPVPFIMKWQPDRFNDLFILFLLAMFSLEISRGITNSSSAMSLLHLALFFCLYVLNIGLNSGFFKNIFIYFFIFFLFVKFIVESREEPSFTGTAPFLSLVCSALLMMFIFLYSGSMVFLTNILSDLSVGAEELSPFWVFLQNLSIYFFYPVNAISSFVVIFLLGFLFFKNYLPSRKKILFFFIVLLGLEIGFRNANLCMKRWFHDRTIITIKDDPFFFDAARWCRVNTPRDCLIICPPYRGGFRAESHRSVFVSWDEQLLYWIAPGYITEYDKRLRMLEFDYFRDKNRAKSWQPSREAILEVAREYGADYLVIERDKPMLFPVLCSNKYFTIYRIED